MSTKSILCIAAAVALFANLANGFNLTFDPPHVAGLLVKDDVNVTVSIHESEDMELADDSVSLRAEPESVLAAWFADRSWNCGQFVCNRTVTVNGRFLGFGKVIFFRKISLSSNGSDWEKLKPELEVTVLRQDKLINKLFIIFVATVVTINYINFGCALEIDIVKEVLKKPIGPAVGFVCQFVIMPLVSYGVGYLLFTDPVLRLGLFTFGCSPGGGASNMWTVLLGGNLNLSITMTFVSTVAAFGTIPLWLFTLGQDILKGTKIVIPYSNIITSLVSLVVPIAIGLLIQKYLPKVAARSKKFLAPICIVLIIAIIVLAAVANTYIFYMLSWRMVIAASLSVWTGFLAGFLVSAAFRFKLGDIVAVSVETGVQNSGIAFVLLSYSLAQPVADMASVVPVAGSMITPIPLFVVLCVMKIRSRCFKSKNVELQALHKKSEEYQSTKTVISGVQEDELKDVSKLH